MEVIHMKNSIMKFFEVIEDKREPWKVKHSLLDVIFIAIVATLCGMDTWQDIADFAEERENWFRKFLRLDNGIPSHDTLERCFKFIEPIHGRIETRTHYFTKDIEWLSMKGEWSGLNSIGMVVRKSIEGEKTTSDTRYFISSLDGDVETFAKAVREHWGIEAMHWNLDVTFSEDKMHSRKDYLPENLAVLKRIALNMLKQETTIKRSVQRKRNKVFRVGCPLFTCNIAIYWI